MAGGDSRGIRVAFCNFFSSGGWQSEGFLFVGQEDRLPKVQGVQEVARTLAVPRHCWKQAAEACSRKAPSCLWRWLPLAIGRERGGLLLGIALAKEQILIAIVVVIVIIIVAVAIAINVVIVAIVIVVIVAIVIVIGAIACHRHRHRRPRRRRQSS